MRRRDGKTRKDARTKTKTKTKKTARKEVENDVRASYYDHVGDSFCMVFGMVGRSVREVPDKQM